MCTIAFSLYHSLYIDYNYNLWGHGDNSHLRLGQKNTEYINKIETPKQLCHLTNIKYIACGFDHSICCDINGYTYSFGSNTYGQLGIDNKNIYSIDIPQQIKLDNICKVYCGSFFSLFLTHNGDIYTVGRGYNGQLGYKQKINYSPKQVSISNVELIDCESTLVICKLLSGKIYSWGRRLNGTKHHNPHKEKNYPKNIISIKSGCFHTLLLDNNGIVYSIGDNSYGQLGYKSKTEVKKPQKINGLPYITLIECGYQHSMCIDKDMNLWVFGDNKYGQLGLGDNITRYIPEKNKNINDVLALSHGGSHTFIKTINNEIYGVGCNDSFQLGINTEYKAQEKLIQLVKDNTELWYINTDKSTQKSARNIL